jgi:hypothetical protein
MTATVSAEVRRLADRFAEVSPGETITHKQMSSVVGRDVLSARNLITQARKLAMAESNIVFDSVRTVGIRRLRADEIPHVGEKHQRRIRRTADAGITIISHGMRGANDMSAEAKREALRQQSVLGTVKHLTYKRNQPVIGEDASEPLSAEDVARQFMEKTRKVRL